MIGKSSMVSSMAASWASVISSQPIPLRYALSQGLDALARWMASESLLYTIADRVAPMSSALPIGHLSKGLPGFSASARVWSLVIRGWMRVVRMRHSSFQ